MKLNKNSRFRTVGLSGFFALCAFLGTAVACPSSAMFASAVDSQNLKIDFSLTNEAAIKAALLQIDFYLKNGALDSAMSKMLTIDFFLENGNPDYQAIFKALGIDFLLNSNMTLWMDGPDSMVAPTYDPLPTGNFVSGGTDLSVTTTAQEGFAVYVYSADGETAMIGTADANNRIAALTATTSQTGFSSNTWGYNLAQRSGTEVASALTCKSSDTQYNALAATQGAADCTFSGNGTADLRLNFGAKVDMTTTADTYKRDVEVKAAPGAANVAMESEVRGKVKRFIAKALSENEELRTEVERRQQESGVTGDIEIANEIVRLTAQQRR